jgi:hypothetical protein
MPTITKTTIIFNDKLKEVVEQVRRENWGMVNILGDVDACLRDSKINANREIREAFDAQINRINFNRPQKAFKKQDYFALFMCVISPHLDDINTWEELIAKKDIRGVEGMRRARDCTCCCGQYIQDICMMVTDNSGCIVGNCCVEKHIITNPASDPSLVEKFKAIKKLQKDDKKAFKIEQEKEANRIRVLAFKNRFPTLCIKCNCWKNPKYDLCYSCAMEEKGYIECKGDDCGNYHDKKYKKCFNCIKGV